MVALPPSRGAVGPYRSMHELPFVVFDVRAETCTLWLGNEPIAPKRAPRSDAATRGTALVGLALTVAVLMVLAGMWAYRQLSSELPLTKQQLLERAHATGSSRCEGGP